MAVFHVVSVSDYTTEMLTSNFLQVQVESQVLSISALNSCLVYDHFAQTIDMQYEKTHSESFTL